MDLIKSLYDLTGKTALVIGGSGVLGGEIARVLSLAGAQTVLTYSGSRDKAESHVQKIEKEGGIARSVYVDVRDESSIEQALDYVSEQYSVPDILINAPGVNSTTPVEDITDEEWNRIMDINLKGSFHACRMLAKRMKDVGKGGSIINISSASSEIPLSKVFTYSISKAGMNNMTRFLAREWAPDHIRVNALMPGFFPAEQNRKILTEERQRSIFNHTPMKRYGKPEELAGAVIWLASDKASSFVTGAIIPVDGGFTAMSI